MHFFGLPECYCFQKPQSICDWCKLLYEIASASIPHSITACSSQWTAQGITKVVAKIISCQRRLRRSAVDHHHGEALLHFLIRPGWVLCLFGNPRQQEALNKQGRSHTSPRISLLRAWYGLHDFRFYWWAEIILYSQTADTRSKIVKHGKNIILNYELYVGNRQNCGCLVSKHWKQNTQDRWIIHWNVQSNTRSWLRHTSLAKPGSRECYATLGMLWTVSP